MGMVSSIAADSHGLFYLLHRGDKADPIEVVNQEGRVLRSWGKGLYKTPHSIAIDPARQRVDRRCWKVRWGGAEV